MFNLPTPELVQKVSEYLTSLGFEAVSANQRWEGDGVFVVGPPPRDPNVHWYLWVNGNDNPFFKTSVTIVFITPKGQDDFFVRVNHLSEIQVELEKNGYVV